ncbi:hypothetical protein DO021_22095 [Desulfobacter hydrogenophilus]|uniref:Uncharacterized protein n=1 Tax=Desulfobacter hydrogenophilus TaxID=2291 RepID=A0A328F9Y2_9BACT|nr:hypothetical protein DO021_22095 [Desulfobacter hydrogenophilus]
MLLSVPRLNSPMAFSSPRITLRKKFQFFESNMIETTMVIPYAKGHLLGQLKNKASMINESYNETGTEVTFKTFPETLIWLQKEME